MATAALHLNREPAANGLPLNVWTGRRGHIRSILLARGASSAVTSHDDDQVRAPERPAHEADDDARTDPAAGAPLSERLIQAFSAANRRGKMVAALHVDVDHVKVLNDTYGRDVGDQLLEEVAARLRETAGPDDIVARVGGDEFVVISCVLDHESATDLAERLCESMRRPFAIADAELTSSVSVGVATLSGATDGTDLLVAASRARDEAKARGRDRWVTRNAAAIT